MRSNRRERGEKNVVRKAREQKRAGRGRGEKREAEEKRRARTDSRVLALRRTGTLASVQPLVCVGRVTIDADGSQGFPTVLPMSHEMFTRRRTHQCLRRTHPTFSTHPATFYRSHMMNL